MKGGRLEASYCQGRYFSMLNHDAVEITTESRMEAWWLLTVKGYKVRSIVRSSPRSGMFGGIKYHTLWVLEAPTDDRKAETIGH
jgi:hypothetical protein